MELIVESIFAALLMLIKTFIFLVVAIVLFTVGGFFYALSILTIVLDLIVFIFAAGKGKLELAKSFIQVGRSIIESIPKISRSFYGK
ncbi:MAG: hypothetical protein AAFY50_07145 [Cyanobacteria bacterium J06648_1]